MKIENKVGRDCILPFRSRVFKMPKYACEDKKEIKENRAGNFHPVMGNRGCYGAPSNPRASGALLTFGAEHEMVGESSDEDDPVESRGAVTESVVENSALTGGLVNLLISIQKQAIGKLIEAELESEQGYISTGKKWVALYRSLSNIYQSEDQGFSARLTAMSRLVDEHLEILPENLAALKSWLELVRDALTLKDIDFERAMSGNLQDIIDRTRQLLANRLLLRFLPEQRLEQFQFLLKQGSLAFGLLSRFRNLPDQASFSDYLQLLKSGQFLKNVAPDSLFSLVDLIEKLKTKLEMLDAELLKSVAAFPTEGGYGEKLEWFLKIINEQPIQRALVSYLDPRMMTLLRTPAALANLFQTYPVEAGALEKLHWLATQADGSNETNPFKGTLLEPVLLNLQQSLVGGKEIVTALEMLMKLTDPEAGKFERMKTLFQPIITPENLLSAASYLTPWGVAARAGLDLFSWYQTLPPESTWEQTFAALMAKIQEIASSNSDRIGAAVGLSGNAAGDLKSVFDALTGIKKEWTWVQTVDWLLKSAKGSPSGRWYYERLLEFCLVWQLYQAARGRDSTKVAQALRQVRSAFISYLPGISGAVLDQIIALLPLLPGLIALRREVTKMPETQSWITWLNSVVSAAGKSHDPSVRRLVEQINEFVENLCIDAISPVFNSLSGVAVTLTQGRPATGSGTARHDGAHVGTSRHEGVARMLCEAGASVGNALFSSVGAIAQEMFEQAVLRGVGANRRYSPLDPMFLTDLALPCLTLGVLPADSWFELTQINPVDIVPVLDEPQIIWGDEHVKRQRIWAGTALAAYWVATSWALYRQVSKRRQPSASGPFYSALPSDPAQLSVLELARDDFGEGASGGARTLNRREAAQTLVMVEEAAESPPAATGFVHFIKKYRDEMAVGGAALLGAGLTFYVTKNFLLAQGPNLDLSEICEKLEFEDITESSDFSELFENTQFASRKILSHGASKKAEDNLKQYVLDLSAGLSRDTLLRKFFDDLMLQLVPKLIKNKGVMKRMNDDFAFLVELDQMIWRMQSYIVKKEIEMKIFTHLKALLLINRVRNYIVHMLTGRYPRKATGYYSITSNKPDFSSVQEFWSKDLVRVYVQSMMHEAGASQSEMKAYEDLLRLIIETAKLYATEYTEGGGVVLVEEGGLIKLAIDGIRERLVYSQGKLIWDKESDPVPAPERTRDSELTAEYSRLIDYLQQASQDLGGKGDHDFAYPRDAESIIKSRFVTERCAEIIEGAANQKIIIPVTYKADTGSAKVAMFSVEQIALGVHEKHPYSKNSRITINWPDFIDASKRTALLDIRRKVAWLDRILINIDVVNKHIADLQNAELDGIVAYTDGVIKKKARQLGVKQDVSFKTAISVVTQTWGGARPGPRRLIKHDYILGQVAFTKLEARQGMMVSPPELQDLVKFLHETDFQTLYQQRISVVRQDAMVRAAFNAISLIKVQFYLDSGVQLYEMKFHGYELVGLFAFEDTDGAFRLFSLVDNSIRSFRSQDDVETNFKWDSDLKKWMLNHSVDPNASWIVEKYGRYPTVSDIPIPIPLLNSYYNDKNDKFSNKITYRGINESEISFFDKFVDRLHNEADKLAKSNEEIEWSRILSWIDVLVFLIQFITAPLGILPAIAINAAAQGVSSISKAIIADDPDEKEAHLLEAALALGLEIAGETAPKLLGMFFRQIASSVAYRRFAAIKLNRKFNRWLDGVDWGKLSRQGESSLSLELIRDISKEVPVKKSANVVAKIEALESLVRLDPVLSPDTADSFAVAQRLNSLLDPAADAPVVPGKSGADALLNLRQLSGDKNIAIEYRAINAWTRLAPDSRIGHLAVTCEIDEVKYVIDPALFEAGGRRVTKNAVLLEQEWVQANQKGLSGVLVKYKDFSSLDEGKQFASNDYSFDVGKTERGTVVLSSPDWYEPDLLNYSGLNRKWRADVDLEGMVHDADGIYTAGVEPDLRRYIKDLDGGVFWVKKDVDMNTWRVINPANPDGYTPPVRREASGRWVRHLDLAGKGGAPTAVRQTHLDGAKLTQARKFIAEGKQRALSQLSSVRISMNASTDSAMIAKLAEVFWGAEWSNALKRPDLVDIMKKNIDTIKKRTIRLDPEKHVEYFNVKISDDPGTPRINENTVAEMDTEKYREFFVSVDSGGVVKYINSYEAGLAFLKSRDDLGADYMGKVIIHEMTHGFEGGGKLSTDDSTYIGIARPDKKHDLTALAKIAIEEPGKAEKNADSYATFIYYLTHFKKNPQKYIEFIAKFEEWKLLRIINEETQFLFDFNVNKNPAPLVKMGRSVRDSVRNIAWQQINDEKKIENLIRYSMQVPVARELSNRVGQGTVELSIRNSLQLDYEGVRRKRFSWGRTPSVDLAKIEVRLGIDNNRYYEALTHLDSIGESPPKLTRNPLDGDSPETAAAQWILKSSRSGSNEIMEIKQVLADFKNEDLLNPTTIDKIHDRVYRPPPGGAYRSARTADNSLFMSLDVANYLFVKQVEKTANIPEHVGDQLFGILVRTHPFGDGNGRTARTLYAIQRLRLSEPKFQALTKPDEDLLSGLEPETAPNLPPEPVAGPSGIVQEEALGAQYAATIRQYLVLEKGDDFHLGYASLSEYAAHLTSWRNGEQPLENQAQDLIIYTAALRARPRGLPGYAATPSPTKESEKKLIFYAPGIYRVFDPDLVSAADRSASSLRTEGPSYTGGFKASEFTPMRAPTGSSTDGASLHEPSFFYSNASETDAISAAIIKGITKYKSSHYTPDFLETGELSLTGGSAIGGDRRADILSLTSRFNGPMTVQQVLRQVCTTGLAYKRIHVCAYRELDESAKLNPAGKGQSPSLGTPVPTDTGDRLISHLVTLITLDTQTATIEETVQGVIEKATNEYVEIDTAGGDRLSIPAYGKLSWGTAGYAPKISDHVVDASGGEPATDSPQAGTLDFRLGDGVRLRYRDGKFYYLTKKGNDINYLLDLVYGSRNQRVKVLCDSLNVIGNVGKIVADDKNLNAIFLPGAEVEFQNLYKVGENETLNSIAVSKVGGGFGPLVEVNRNLPSMNEIINNPDVWDDPRVNLDVSNIGNTKIPVGTIIRLPLIIELDFDVYQQYAEQAYFFLAQKFYSFEDEGIIYSLRDWNDQKLLASGTGIEQHRPNSAGKFVYFAPI